MAVILSGPVLQLDSFPLLESSSVIPIRLDDECRHMNASQLIAIHLQQNWVVVCRGKEFIRCSLNMHLFVFQYILLEIYDWNFNQWRPLCHCNVQIAYQLAA